MPVTTEIRDGAVIVTLRWTDKRNALSADDADLVAEAITGAGAESAARALVLAGEGQFCAGGDLPFFAELGRTLTPEEIHRTIYGRVQAMVRALRDCPVPTIAAVDGAAVGLGMDLALACDMRFVGPKGFLMQGWARAGLIPGTGGTALLHRVAPERLWQLLATQERVSAERAVELGLAESGEPDALTAALARVEALSYIDRRVLGDYAALARRAAWPDEENFDQAGARQGHLLTSQHFRDLTRQLLGK
ncbi:enoyl-CoA hydratase/isomerase family protein [Rhodococcus sp. NPDC003382]|uniref:enoyl-CoA hydratase/isomerase family protein n=1 Tax=Rhodococcus sp. HM1 TaxID=2937759 RepID=UPI00200A61F6|nr:enoyl-CoA hydratase/isomerase family protein [Rhodococcus sp. HM1]MCK8669768.1 enoyl-CoA hydratase/isomerase family protein [Rhodococcus sp. HM1]